MYYTMNIYLVPFARCTVHICYELGNYATR